MAGFGLAPKLCPDGKTLVFVMDGVQTMRKRNLDTNEESEVVKPHQVRCLRRAAADDDAGDADGLSLLMSSASFTPPEA